MNSIIYMFLKFYSCPTKGFSIYWDQQTIRLQGRRFKALVQFVLDPVTAKVTFASFLQMAQPAYQQSPDTIIIVFP